MMWSWGYYDGWGWLWMAGTALLLWGALIALAIWAIRALSEARQKPDSTMSTLRQRLAAGQITQEEFERTQKVLES